MAKIGRNASCPCGSGRKYKKCCLGKKGNNPMTSLPNPSWELIEEKKALGVLLGDSEQFRNYYNEIRPQLKDFCVVKDSGLPVGVKARVTRDAVKTYMRIRNDVCPLENVNLIAHELGHLYQDEQGYPTMGAINDSTAGSALNSAFKDPLDDLFLVKKGFILDEDRKQQVLSTREQLSERPVEPKDLLNKALWIANYLKYLLNQEILGAHREESEFIAWFSERYPNIAAETQKIAGTVIAMGFDTPDKMMKAMESARRSLRAAGGVIMPPEKAQ